MWVLLYNTLILSKQTHTIKTLPTLVLLVLLGTSVFSVHAAVQGNSQDYTISNIQIGNPAVEKSTSTPSSTVKKESVQKPAPSKSQGVKQPAIQSKPQVKVAPIALPSNEDIAEPATSTSYILKEEEVQKVSIEGMTASQSVMSSVTLPSVFSGAIMLPFEEGSFRSAGPEQSNYNIFHISVIACISATLILLGYNLIVVKREQ